MTDPTEPVRRIMVNTINSEAESNSKDSERKRLEAIHGQVWDTSELSQEFVVKRFMAPYVVCVNKETSKKGTMLFQHSPRFYFLWKED